MIALTVNGKQHQIDADPRTPLLYVLRNNLKLHAAKFGCGLGQCGSCTVLVDKTPVFSCLTPISVLTNRNIRTVEGLGTADNPGPVNPGTVQPVAAIGDVFPRDRESGQPRPAESRPEVEDCKPCRT